VAKKWSEVAASPAYQALDANAKEEARQSYFREVVAPQVPTEEHGAALAEFDANTKTPAPSSEPTVPLGYHEVTINGQKELRKDFSFKDMLSSLPPVGAVELAAEGATNLGAEIVAGLSSLAQLPFRGPDVAAETARNLTEEGTYQPSSQAAADIKGGLGELLGGPIQAAQRGLSKLGPAAETFIPAGLKFATEVLPLGMAAKPAARAVQSARLGREVITDEAATRAAAPVRDPVAIAEAAKYKLLPSEKKPGSTMAGLTEGFANRGKLQQNYQLANQEQTNSWVKKRIGLSETDKFTPQALEKAEAPHVAVYEKVRAIPRIEVDDAFRKALRGVKKPSDVPEAPSVRRLKADFEPLMETTGEKIINTIGELRASARTNKRSDKRTLQLRGEAEQKLADNFEDLLERQTEALNPGLGAEYKEARKGFARIYTVKDSLVGQNVDAAKLARIVKKDKRIGGEFKMIADIAENFPSAVKLGQKTTAGSSVMDAALPLAGGGFALGAGGSAGIGAFLAAMAARPGVRALLSRTTGRGAPEGALSDYLNREPSMFPPRSAESRLGSGEVPFTPTRPVTPPLASQLAGDLELLPDDVPNPDIVSIVMENPDLATQLAGDLGLAPENFMALSNDALFAGPAPPGKHRGRMFFKPQAD